MWMDFLDELTDDEDLLELLDIVEPLDPPRKPKKIKKRPDHFHLLSEAEFIERFRLSKQACVSVLQSITHEISSLTARNSAVSPMTMLLLTLRFYATGSMLLVVGDFCGVHKSTASRIILKVSRAIATLRPHYIHFPQTAEEFKTAQEGFYKIGRFPKCIGAIDCTHIKIQSPGGNKAEIFRNRKGFFSFNVQGICDVNLKIINLVARWPGSTHDSTIFNNSQIKLRLESMDNILIVGDGGYAVKPYLITPLRDPVTPAENLFNESQIRTRNPIERCFGVWKRRFPILALGIRLKFTSVQAIIVATAVLHNIAIDMNLPEPAVTGEIDDAINLGRNITQNNIEGNGDLNNRIRHALINDYFRGLLNI